MGWDGDERADDSDKFNNELWVRTGEGQYHKHEEQDKRDSLNEGVTV